MRRLWIWTSIPSSYVLGPIFYLFRASFSKHPNHSPNRVSNVHVTVILHLFGQHTFLLQAMICSYSQREWPSFVETSLSHAPVQDTVNANILINLFSYLHTEFNHAVKMEFPSFFHPEQNCWIGKKNLRILWYSTVLNLLSAAWSPASTSVWPSIAVCWSTSWLS